MQARSTKTRKSEPRKLLSLDQIEDLWIVVEEALDTDDTKTLRAGIQALELILADNRARMS